MLSLLSGVFVLQQVYKSRTLLLYLIVMGITLSIVLFLGNTISYAMSGKMVIDRLEISDKANLSTITNRIKMAENAFEIGIAYPFLGTGIGTYEFYNNVNNIFIPQTQHENKTLIEPLRGNPISV